ncbi:hypothetical protein SAMN02745115_01549 [[Eubacterium] yurii]|jgi:hypothetical protein|nr:hypothetical protein SAMN02745115_01549 [[Eubacterium] yurii]
MNKSDKIIYLVEGECEKILIQAIKNEYIASGLIYIFNPLQEKVTKARLRLYPPKTCIVLVFDTDVYTEDKIDRLKININILKKSKNIKDIVLIPQVKNFEEEILYSTTVGNIKKLFDSKTKSEFKDYFIKNDRKVLSKLEKYKFDICKFWSRKAENKYKIFDNSSNKIKL